MKPVYVEVRMIDHEKTGLLVRRERQKQGISVTDLAAIAGISVSYLCCLENGDRAWSEDLFARVMGGLSCDT
jgi:transcriptional regulator with XRE-family HTH domain